MNTSMYESVRVAVNIRPLIHSELILGLTNCITVIHSELPQVKIGSHSFKYDHVYGGRESTSSTLYNECVAPLIDAIFHGYNATILAYGQTGSGKTHTMGTSYTSEERNFGIIPQVMENVFERVDLMKDSAEFLIKISFIEIYKEEVYDLLDPNFMIQTKGKGAFDVKPAPMKIREMINGSIRVDGVIEKAVNTKEEMGLYLSRGCLARAAGITNMNSQSSRSHAIFTISIEQKKISRGTRGENSDDVRDIILCAKLHFVDLAGSEQADANDERLKEGIHINKGLLALGNVISALGGDRKEKGGHIPYRNSKLTRLLQDSLGGNSKTVMIACVSPANTNAKETLKTLQYANRARKIQNKASINYEPMVTHTTQMQGMRAQHDENKVYELEQQNKALLGDIDELRYNLATIQSASDAAVQKLEETCCQKLNVLEAKVSELKKKQDAQAQLLREKSKSDEAERRLQDENQRIKSHKVQLQLEMKQESVRFRLYKASSEKEVLQLKKEGRRNEYEMQKLLDLSQRRKMFLQRKAEEANMESKRLMELLESQKAKVRSKYDRQMEEIRISRMEMEIARLKEEAETLRCCLQEKELYCQEKDSEIRDLNEKVVEVNSLDRNMEMQKAELIHEVKSEDSTLRKHLITNESGLSSDMNINGGHKSDLREQDKGKSIILLEDETKRTKNLASQEVMLLRSGLEIEKRGRTNNNQVARRRPLSDIGNMMVKSNVPKPLDQRKIANSKKGQNMVIIEEE